MPSDLSKVTDVRGIQPLPGSGHKNEDDEQADDITQRETSQKEVRSVSERRKKKDVYKREEQEDPCKSASPPQMERGHSPRSPPTPLPAEVQVPIPVVPSPPPPRIRLVSLEPLVPPKEVSVMHQSMSVPQSILEVLSKKSKRENRRDKGKMKPESVRQKHESAAAEKSMDQSVFRKPTASPGQTTDEKERKHPKSSNQPLATHRKGSQAILKHTVSSPNVNAPSKSSNIMTVENNSEAETIFEITRCVSRPAIVKEKNLWMKKQTVDMTRKLPFGVQPGEADCKRSNSHTGVPSRVASTVSVSNHNSSPTLVGENPALPAHDSAQVRKQPPSQGTAELHPPESDADRKLPQSSSVQPRKKPRTHPKIVKIRKSAKEPNSKESYSKLAKTCYPTPRDPARTRSEPNIHVRQRASNKSSPHHK